MQTSPHIKQYVSAALCLLFAASAASAQTLTNRYAFDGNANDGIGSLNGTATTAAASVTEAPLFTSSTPTGADTSFASGSIQLGMNKATSIASAVTFGAPALYDGKAGSYSLWFNPTDLAGGQELFSNVGVDGPRTILNGTGIIRTNGFTGSPFDTTATATESAWNHIAVTWDDAAGSLSIALNGVTKTFAFPAEILTDPARLMLGNFETSNGNIATQFVGEIYDLQIYDGVLSTAQITQLNSNPGAAIPEPSAYAMLAGLLAVGSVVLRRRMR